MIKRATAAAEPQLQDFKGPQLTKQIVKCFIGLLESVYLEHFQAEGGVLDE